MAKQYINRKEIFKAICMYMEKEYGLEVKEGEWDVAWNYDPMAYTVEAWLKGIELNLKPKKS